MNRALGHWQPAGTVYGGLLTFSREWDLWAPRMQDKPYLAPPRAPVLYIKSANTFSPAGQSLRLEDGLTEVALCATLGLVMGEEGQVQALALLADWMVPHASYFRPAVRWRCRDGFLGLPAQATPVAHLGDWSALSWQVWRNDELVQTSSLAQLREPVSKRLADLQAFMPLQPGEVLMVGSDCLPDGTRPLFGPGDRVRISAPGLVSVEQGIEPTKEGMA